MNIERWARKPPIRIQDEIMVSGDYSQVELALAKILVGETTGDVYKLLAAAERGIAVEDVTPEQRLEAKNKYWMRFYVK